MTMHDLNQGKREVKPVRRAQDWIPLRFSYRC